MQPRTSRDVVTMLEQMGDRRLSGVAETHVEEVVKPLRTLIDAASETGDDKADARRLAELLNGTLSDVSGRKLVADLTEHLVQSAMIGAATASLAGEEGSRQAAEALV